MCMRGPYIFHIFERCWWVALDVSVVRPASTQYQRRYIYNKLLYRLWQYSLICWRLCVFNVFQSYNCNEMLRSLCFGLNFNYKTIIFILIFSFSQTFAHVYDFYAGLSTHKNSCSNIMFGKAFCKFWVQKCHIIHIAPYFSCVFLFFCWYWCKFWLLVPLLANTASRAVARAVITVPLWWQCTTS